MKQDELRCVMATKAAPNERMLIEIPRGEIGNHYSSITDYLDKVVNYDTSMMRKIDKLISRFHLGAVSTTFNGHYGSVLLRINERGNVVRGEVIYFDADNGNILRQTPITDHLYNWYCFDYYTDNEVFFGEHLLSNKPVAIVQEEKTALPGTLAEPAVDWLAVGEGYNLTNNMMSKLAGKRVVLFPDDISCDYWEEQFGARFKVDRGFVHRDINRYLIDRIRGRGSP